MKTLEKMLAEAHADQEKLRAEKMQLEAENYELKNQLGDSVVREKSKALGLTGVLPSNPQFTHADSNLSFE